MSVLLSHQKIFVTLSSCSRTQHLYLHLVLQSHRSALFCLSSTRNSIANPVCLQVSVRQKLKDATQLPGPNMFVRASYTYISNY